MEMSKFADELIESMRQAARHASGRKVRGMRVTRVEIPDVKAIRRSLPVKGGAPGRRRDER
jgi:putative transcriptional regulator